MSGLYIHIPFCRSRCLYCGFYSTTRPEMQDRYVAALCHELTLCGHEITPPTTIYIGGGTPSQLSAHNLHHLFDAIAEVYGGDTLKSAEEITIECNPDDITPDFCHTLRSLPISRVSLGCQTFSNERLRFVHRRHTAQQIPLAVTRLREVASIANISLDLMFGFPGETLSEWLSDIDNVLALHPQHISAYSLQYEEGTPLHQLLQQGMIQEIPDTLSNDMYFSLCDRLTHAGYDHYEISNFSLPSFHSRHNSSYWNDTPYLGIGAAAHSYLKPEGQTALRRWNTPDLQGYIEQAEQSRFQREEDPITPTTHYNDLITTALRTRLGLSLDQLTPDQQAYIRKEAAPHIASGLLIVEGNHLHLTRLGIPLSDLIMADLVMA